MEFALFPIGNTFTHGGFSICYLRFTGEGKWATKFKRLLKRQWLFWESLRWLLFPWRNWTIWVEILTVSLLMASFASYGNDRFRHGYSTFSQSFWLGCGCVSRLSRGSVFWWDHQGGLTRDSRVRSNEKNPGWLFDIGNYTTQLYREYNKPL